MQDFTINFFFLCMSDIIMRYFVLIKKFDVISDVLQIIPTVL